MKFKTWEEMYDYLASGRDLYNVLLKKYVFMYNDDGALCAYHIAPDEAKEIATDAATGAKEIVTDAATGVKEAVTRMDR